MSGPSLTQVIGGPALVSYRGSSFYSKSDITLEIQPDLFDIEVDPFGLVDKRVSSQPVKVRFVPAGEWKALAILWYYATLPFGDLITPVRTMGVVVANVVTLLNHQLQSGDAVYVKNSGGHLPTGLTAGVLYYIHYTSSDAVTFHATRANALTGASPLAVSNDGTGTNRLVVNNPLTIQTIDASSGKLITLYNAAVSKMPGINGTATATLIDEVEFEAFIVDGASVSDNNSLFSVVSSPYVGDPTFDPVNILTQPIAVGWGVVAPFDTFYTKTGVKIDFALTLQNIDIDGYGILSKRISGLVVTAKLTPIGIDAEQFLNAMTLQGAGANIGRSIGQAGHNLTLTAPGFYVRLNQAGLVGGPEIFSRSKDAIGEITFQATRTFVNGFPQPLFMVGTSSIS